MSKDEIASILRTHTNVGVQAHMVSNIQAVLIRNSLVHYKLRRISEVNIVNILVNFANIIAEDYKLDKAVYIRLFIKPVIIEISLN